MAQYQSHQPHTMSAMDDVQFYKRSNHHFCSIMEQANKRLNRLTCEAKNNDTFLRLSDPVLSLEGKMENLRHTNHESIATLEEEYSKFSPEQIQSAHERAAVSKENWESLLRVWTMHHHGKYFFPCEEGCAKDKEEVLRHHMIVFSEMYPEQYERYTKLAQEVEHNPQAFVLKFGNVCPHCKSPLKFGHLLRLDTLQHRNRDLSWIC